MNTLTLTMALSKALFALMILLRPESPFRETFEKTATAIAKASIRTPVFPGEDGPMKTGYLAVAVADFESGFQPDAEGDCDKTTKEGTCVKGSKPHSFCLLQVNESNFKGFRTTRAEIQSDIDVCVTVGIAMMKQSFGIARGLRAGRAGGATTREGSQSTASARHSGCSRNTPLPW